MYLLIYNYIFISIKVSILFSKSSYFLIIPKRRTNIKTSEFNILTRLITDVDILSLINITIELINHKLKLSSEKILVLMCFNLLVYIHHYMSLLFINIVTCIKFETLSVSFIFQKCKNLKTKRLSNNKLILQNLIITNVDVASYVYILLCSTYMYKCIYIYRDYKKYL